MSDHLISQSLIFVVFLPIQDIIWHLGYYIGQIGCSSSLVFAIVYLSTKFWGVGVISAELYADTLMALVTSTSLKKCMADKSEKVEMVTMKINWFFSES